MNIALFDIDGTLTESNEIDSICFADAFRDVLDVGTSSKVTPRVSA
jgi:phosphoglycolate phosphatase-like HAD superfamily hydrolase